MNASEVEAVDSDGVCGDYKTTVDQSADVDQYSIA